MNKLDANKIADYVTYYQLDKMFDKAMQSVDWRQVSNINKNMTKGASWNILYPCFETMSSGQLRRKVIRNMVWEFGDFLPEEAKLNKDGEQKSRAEVGPYHEDPIF